MTASALEARASHYYRAGVALALMAAFLTVWTTIVRDDGHGLGFLIAILAAGVGALAAWFEAAGMARTMLGVALLQPCVGIAIVTAPVTAAIPGASSRILAFSAGYALVWLLSAACFRAAARATSIR